MKVSIPLFCGLLFFSSFSYAGHQTKEEQDAVRIDGFWKQHIKMLVENWLPHCIKQVEIGGASEDLANLINAGKMIQSHGAMVRVPFDQYQGADAFLYNIYESMCMALRFDASGDPSFGNAQDYLRSKIHAWTDIILKAQCEDGYIQSYHTLTGLARFYDKDSHELYNMGYFIEAGIEHYKTFGESDRRMYDAVKKCADYLYSAIGPDADKLWIHGHPGIGYALCRLGRLVNEVEGDGRGSKYVTLAKHLLDNRHNGNYKTEYHLTHMPVIDFDEPVGHAVRAVYLYTAMADIAELKGDRAYLAASDRLWDRTVNRKYYLTGGVGALYEGEAFSGDYDLPNSSYCESCAGSGMIFWADRMSKIHRDGHYQDVLERVNYNVVLGAIDAEGRNFYYQNPLDSSAPRYSWHVCPCCVGNVPRTIFGYLLNQVYQVENDTLYVHQYVAGESHEIRIGGSTLKVKQRTAYPWNGEIDIVMRMRGSSRFTVKLRVPDREESRIYQMVPAGGGCRVYVNSQEQHMQSKKGYLSLTRRWESGDVIKLVLPMKVQRIYSIEKVKENRGRVAFQRGPIVYNFEEIDQAKPEMLHEEISRDVDFDVVWNQQFLGGVMTLVSSDGRLTGIPNYRRLHRGKSSQVWMIEDRSKVHNNRLVRPELDSRTLDQVYIGDSYSESMHGFKGHFSESGRFDQHFWRHAGVDGWFSYTFDVADYHRGMPVSLLCTYWGSESGHREFEIFVDDQRIGTQKLMQDKPEEFFDVEYRIPETLFEGKQQITVKIQSIHGGLAGALYDLRLVK
ncbi:beta-L-arabinofuranosidase domain-containing protein [Poriferisphaera sp. WC338]|uniref:glycoside hydrolase family 127 protein n=1 Tax=Poriferisphaera sp. WC338 TaxID=3425129 RepID=UPI003D8143AB